MGTNETHVVQHHTSLFAEFTLFTRRDKNNIRIFCMLLVAIQGRKAHNLRHVAISQRLSLGSPGSPPKFRNKNYRRSCHHVDSHNAHFNYSQAPVDPNPRAANWGKPAQSNLAGACAYGSLDWGFRTARLGNWNEMLLKPRDGLEETDAQWQCKHKPNWVQHVLHLTIILDLIGCCFVSQSP